MQSSFGLGLGRRSGCFLQLPKHYLNFSHMLLLGQAVKGHDIRSLTGCRKAGKEQIIIPVLPDPTYPSSLQVNRKSVLSANALFYAIPGVRRYRRTCNTKPKRATTFEVSLITSDRTAIKIVVHSLVYLYDTWSITSSYCHQPSFVLPCFAQRLLPILHDGSALPDHLPRP